MALENTEFHSFSTTNSGITASGAATTFSTANILHFVIDGQIYNKAAVSGGTTPTTDIVSGAAITITASKARNVLWLIDASGNIAVTAGATVDWDGGTAAPSYGFGNNVPVTPIAPDGYAPFAITLLKGGSTVSGTWTFGSSNWNATGMTVAHKNISTLPQRPIYN